LLSPNSTDGYHAAAQQDNRFNPVCPPEMANSRFTAGYQSISANDVYKIELDV